MDRFGEFYRENKDRLYAYLLRMTGDVQASLDLVQESFLRYLRRYGEAKVEKSLLYAIARNGAMDLFRKKKMAVCDADEYGDSHTNPEQQLLDREALDDTIKAIATLKPPDRELIALLTAGDLTYQEIGRILDISESNVKVRVHRARTKLRQTLASGMRKMPEKTEDGA